MATIKYTTDLTSVDWAELKATLKQDRFDNGCTAAQLEKAFTQSAHICLAIAEGKIVGTGRAMSDGVCNGYIVDVWTLSAYRRRGIASTLVRHLLEKMPGQHVYLFTDDAMDFYKKLGFTERPVGLEFIVGKWLDNTPTY
jgi:ribosomal protein S18 acetylase RimI-like enzyme